MQRLGNFGAEVAEIAEAGLIRRSASPSLLLQLPNPSDQELAQIETANVEVFTCLEEAKLLATDWREDYNANHPHSALDMMSPERFAASLRSPSGFATRGGDQERYSTQTNHGLSLEGTNERGPVIGSPAPK
jgi:hypothetical protein